MIPESNNHPLVSCLSNEVLKAYIDNKELINKISKVIKEHTEEKNLHGVFYHSYVCFAIKLEEEGLYYESNAYMDICAMYYDLMDRPDVLIKHESFFRDPFNAFDELLYARINNLEDYERISHEFLMYSSYMQEYYYTEVAIPSPDYDEEFCKEMIGKLAGGLK